jgi:hypothetical protein
VAGKREKFSQFWSLRFDLCLCGWAAAKAEVDVDLNAVKSDGAFSFVFRGTGDPSLPAAYFFEWIRDRVAYNPPSLPLPSLLSNVQQYGRGWHSYTETGNNHRDQI